MKRSVAIVISLLGFALSVWSQGEVHWLEHEHDFGTIKEEDGKVSCVMRMVNTGDSAMVIIRVQSTCGCTATDFTRTEIAPGDTARVTLIYNPAMRPGQFEKDVWVYTTGTPRRSRLTITGKVIGAVSTIDSSYPVAAGNLRLETENVPLGEMYRGAKRNAYINAYNASADTLVVSTQGSKEHVKITAVPDTVPPGEASAVVVHYDTSKAPLWGFNADTLIVLSEALHNSPTAMGGLTRIYVMAQVMETFDKLTAQQLQHAPKAVTDRAVIDFDRIAATGIASQCVTLKNSGAGDLIVRRAWCPDRAVTVNEVTEKIKKGRTGKIAISVDPAKVENGILNTQLTLMTNDPVTPVMKLRIVGIVTANKL